MEAPSPGYPMWSYSSFSSVTNSPTKTENKGHRHGPSLVSRDTGGMDVRVGIVEDDALLRATLVHSLSSRDDFRVVSASGTAEDILESAQSEGLDVALLDVHLGVGPTGFDVAKSLRRSLPAVGIVFLSSVKDPRLLGQKPHLTSAGSAVSA